MGNVRISFMEKSNIQESANVLSVAMLDAKLHVAVLQGKGEKERQEIKKMFTELFAQLPGIVFLAKEKRQIVGVMRMKSCEGFKPVDAPEDPEDKNDIGWRKAVWHTEWARHEPKRRHWHLGPIGVLPSHQGRGIGSMLMERFCMEVDACKAEAYLETDVDKNVRFYEKFGFKVISESDIFSVKNRYMLRPSMGKNSSEVADGRQETGKAIHSFMDMVAGEAEHYAADHTSPMSPLLEEIENYTLNKTEYPSWLTGRVEGRFLQLIIVLSGFRNVIDIGTFTGYSALAMAESIPPDGKVLTIEHDSANADIAQGFFDRSPQGCKINLQRGEAIDILKSLPPEATDLVFIDADKTSYLAYYHESMRILRKGGLIVVDNALWYGRIFEPKDESSKAIALFNEEVNADNRVEKLFLTLCDGIYLIRKKSI